MARFGYGAIALGVMSVLATTTVWAADPPPKPSTKALMQRRIELAPDASYTSTTHAETQILQGKAIQSAGQPKYPFRDSLQTLEITEAYTLKKDGTKIPVAPGAIITQQLPGTAGGFSDLKEKVVIFPNLEVGDTTVITRKQISQPQIPHFFSYAGWFGDPNEVGTADFTFAVPKSLPVYFDTEDITVHKSSSGDNILYTVHYEENELPPVSNDYTSPVDRLPRLFVSTSPNWDEFAKAYGAIALPKIIVTPKIQAQADKITAGVTDKREQVRLIYQWVAEHVRYVALEFGAGGYIAHDPDEILANAYGDCKDHSVLFSAMLNAKGIDSDLVIINTGKSYTAPKVPAPGVFNHMISYIPSLSLYADTTQRSYAFSYLPLGEYGKPVVHIGKSGKALRIVPVLNEKDAVFAYSEHQKLAADGAVTGTGKYTASGAGAGTLRGIGAVISGNVSMPGRNMPSPDKVAPAMLSKRGFSEATGNFDIPQPHPATADYAIGTTWQGKQPKMLSEAFAMPAGLTIESIAGGLTTGPIAIDRYKTVNVIPCYSNKGTEDYTLEFPAGKRVSVLPADASIETSEIKYSSHWSQAKNTVSVHREFTAHFAEPLCRGSQREGILAGLKRIRADLDTKITLVAAE